MTKTILVAHDGHAMSDAALTFAIPIAKSMNMNIKLVRIVPEVLDFSSMSHWSPPQRSRVRRDVEWHRKQAIERDYKKLQKQLSIIRSKDVEGTAIVAEGNDVAEKIAEIIRKEKPYMVVVGSRKLKSKGLSRIKILGSVARKLSEESTRPILIVN
jgi:nucleotide-binding universal stress UspA family protein